MHTLHLSLTEDVSSLGQSRAPVVVVVVVVVMVVVRSVFWKAKDIAGFGYFD